MSSNKCLNLAQLQALIDRKEDLNRLNVFGQSYLHDAVDLGLTAAIQLLLANGPDIDVRNQEDVTPLAFAHTPEVAQVLFDNGADIYSTSADI